MAVIAHIVREAAVGVCHRVIRGAIAVLAVSVAKISSVQPPTAVAGAALAAIRPSAC